MTATKRSANETAGMLRPEHRRAKAPLRTFHLKTTDRSITNADEVIGQTLHNHSALCLLNGCMVHRDKDGLCRLDDDAAVRLL